MTRDIKENVGRVMQQLEKAAIDSGRDPSEITLCAATKVQSGETIQEAIAAGITVCGENRVQEMMAHLEENAYEGAQVHFIGHLQRNKVKYVVGKADLIQSVDGMELLEMIEKQAEKLGIVQDILIEVNIGQEESKSGVTPAFAHELAKRAGELEHVRLRGLMAIPPVSLESGGNRQFFAAMHELFVDMKKKKYDNENSMDILSMGMSNDFADAIAEGSTLIRVGTALFGARPANRAHG